MNVQSTSGDGGGAFTVSASVPVAAPGTVSQSITMAFDPSRAQVTSASGIVAPTGWTLTYSSDGSTFGTAPSTPSGWAAIRAVRATGSIQSGGDSSGLQIATGSGLASAPPSGAFNAGGGGDGWDVAFDEQGNVYNTFHHDGYWGSGFITPGLHCHTRTGASCGPGWPFALRVPNGTIGPDGISGQPWYHTNDQAMQWVDSINNRVWIPTSMNDGTAASGNGFVCVDVSNLAVGPSWCGGGIRNAFVRLGTTVCGRDCALGLATVDNKLFSWDAGTGKLLCLDPYGTRSGNLPGVGCANQPYSIGSISSTSLNNGYSLMAAQGLVWGTSATEAMCFNPSTLSMCSGWTAGTTTLNGTASNMSFDIPDSSGAPGAVCFTRYDSPRGCFAADGSSRTALTGTHAGSALMAYLPTTVTATTLPKYAVTSGTRVYWADGSWPGGGKVHCFDTSAASGAGAACSNWPVNVSAYTATIDSQNQNCIWTNTDNGTISTIDAITGGSTCTTPPSVADFSAPVIVPRLACSSSSSLQQWRSFKLTAPAANTYSNAYLTVLSATGSVLPGWNRVLIPSNGRTVDLSSLSVQTSGLAPRFRVALADKTTTAAIGGDVTVVGDAPQLCVPLQSVAWCPSGPARIAGSLSAPNPIVVTTIGEAQPASGPAEVFNNAASSISVAPPSDSSCLGTLNGTATMASSSAVVPNAQVRLLSSTGAVLATSTTDSSGNYSFTRLLAGNGYRVEFGPTSQGAANAATTLSASTNRSVTANATTTVNGVYALLRTNVLSGRAAYGQNVMVTPEPNDSSGTQTYASFTKTATCVVDPSDNQCKSTVVIPGQGSWVANTTTGTISFVPNAGYSGTTTSVAYRLTETSSSTTTWNYASAVIDAPVVTTTTTIPAATSTVSVPPSSTARAASTGTLVTQVAVPSAGRVVQTGTVVIGGVRIVAVSCVPVSVTRAGSVSARCSLTSAARRALRQSGISVSMTTKFTARDGSVQTTKTTIKLKKPAILPVTR